MSMLTILTDIDKSSDHHMFSALFCSIANTLASIELLAHSGFDFQALTLLRNLIEQYMNLLTLTLYPEKREPYRTALDAETARKVWHDSFSKKRFLQQEEPYWEL